MSTQNKRYLGISILLILAGAFKICNTPKLVLSQKKSILSVFNLNH
jgi:hypothetical protein